MPYKGLVYLAFKDRSLGMYFHWQDCDERVIGYSKAVFKKYVSLPEAQLTIRVLNGARCMWSTRFIASTSTMKATKLLKDNVSGGYPSFCMWWLLFSHLNCYLIDMICNIIWIIKLIEGIISIFCQVMHALLFWLWRRRTTFPLPR